MPRHDGSHFANGIFKLIFMNANFCISNEFSLEHVSYLIYNMAELAQIMSWCRKGDKPLSDRIMTHTCVSQLKMFVDVDVRLFIRHSLHHWCVPTDGRIATDHWDDRPLADFDPGIRFAYCNFSSHTNTNSVLMKYYRLQSMYFTFTFRNVQTIC